MTMPTPSGPDQQPGDDEGHKLGPTRIRDLMVVAVVVAIALWILIHYNYGAFPSLPWLSGISLYVVAALEVVIGFIVRKRVAEKEIGRGKGQLHPINAARLVALAKASAILGAVAAGGWAGVLVFLLQNGILEAARADRIGAIVGLVGGIVLAAAALWLEHCCRAPDDPSADNAETTPNSPPAPA
ncbi:DUF3180 domain-containing protein [Gordonia neofelifaecis]|uniref:DUF3180 domain-containing protein n=1 Tax=Gordonia neofelifaecis NRRL B-59395 TaxID=644548 RepID=F1YLN9_9ACTN|nr:DUF3180 domain-containing protein [Gordonia neofelifaecis]EGD54433.1 hypothetical protein SCNU_14154 [Gordonia neofelifaecis NRRL B-59395]